MAHTVDSTGNPLTAWAGMVIAACVYYLAARFGMALLTLQPANISLLWLPSGIGLAMYLHWGVRALPLIALASFTANYPGMAAANAAMPLLHTLVSASLNAGLAWLTARVLRSRLPAGLTRAQDLLPFGVWVCLLPVALHSALLASNLVAGGYFPLADAPRFVLMLLQGDSLGIVLVYPLYQGYMDWRSERRRTGQLSSHATRWSLGVNVAVALCLLASFSVQPGVLYLIAPALLLLAFHSNLFGFAATSLLTVVAIVAATTAGLGPLTATGAADTNARVMAFVFANGLTALGIALQQRQLHASEYASRLWQNAAEHDLLTGLLNRRAFLPCMQREHELTLRGGKPYALATLDLDHFKAVNDTYGHQAGDEVLRVFASVMTEMCRAIDAVARLGGEEFAILLPETSAQEAAAVMERIRAALAQRVIDADGREIRTTSSIGIATFDAQASPDDIFARADQALYAAKMAGRNRVVIAGQVD